MRVTLNNIKRICVSVMHSSRGRWDKFGMTALITSRCGTTRITHCLNSILKTGVLSVCPAVMMSVAGIFRIEGLLIALKLNVVRVRTRLLHLGSVRTILNHEVLVSSVFLVRNSAYLINQNFIVFLK